ncbi:MAG: glycosyltransferase family 92 protein [Balneola sp.]
MKKNYLSFVSNFKNENPYLKEWLDYHIKAGIDHFYLFDQCGSQESKDILEPYIEQELVTVHDWTNISPKYDGPTLFFQKNKNHMGYMYTAKNYRKDTTWLLKIDIDEFLFLKDPKLTFKKYLSQYEGKDIRAVRVPRIDFGHNNHITKPEGGVLENYFMRDESPSDYKDIAYADYLNDNNYCFSSHRWSYRLLPRGRIFMPGQTDPIRINHYYTKSKEEYFDRQNISKGRRVSEDDFRVISDRCNQVRDDSILRFLPLS